MLIPQVENVAINKKRQHKHDTEKIEGLYGPKTDKLTVYE
jgi:hypothetical protein